MPASGNLTSLAGAKAALCARIAAQREAIAAAAAGAARPVIVIDQCVGFWRGLPPVVRLAGPALLALAAARCLRSPSVRTTLRQWIPILLGALRL